MKYGLKPCLAVATKWHHIPTGGVTEDFRSCSQSFPSLLLSARQVSGPKPLQACFSGHRWWQPCPLLPFLKVSIQAHLHPTMLQRILELFPVALPPPLVTGLLPSYPSCCWFAYPPTPSGGDISSPGGILKKGCRIEDSTS
jgi:hypothetical protein